MLGIIGREVGDNWEEWRDHLHYLDYVVLVAIVAGIAYLLIRRRRDAAAASAEPSSEPVGSSQRALSDAIRADRVTRGRAALWASSRARRSCCRSPARRTST